ncbi:nose resistant to fluoxetine protein 6-like [Lycorma delicatula]|uniref:nose resistant to fluoxetine protein 6-like n=1 Tax=Lycorma delicatula TaxID=130591 RepID=UPI003F5140B9
MKPQPMNIVPPLPISAVNASNILCRNHSRMLEDALSKGVLWAQQMWDASAKSPVGILSGNVFQLGDFDECLGVSQPVKGKYCIVQIHINVPPGHNFVSPLTIDYSPYLHFWDKIYFGGSRSKQRLDQLKWALCVPQSCSVDDLQSSLDDYIRKINMKDRLTIYVEQKACTIKDNPRYNFSLADLTFSAVIILILLVSITATVYDFTFFKGEGNSPPSNLLLCLSARRSYHSLFRREKPISGLDLTPMYAIHFLSITCVVLGHRYAVALMGPTQNYELVEKIYRNYWISMWMGHMDLFVDSFFVMSGFLLGLLLPLQCDTSFVNPVTVYLHRYLRLMPAFILVTFFYTTLFYKIGDGPLWNLLVGGDQEACSHNWWTNLVFLSNVVNTKELCVMHCWYIACDFQYMAVATIIILAFKKHAKLMVAVFILLFCMTVSAVFVHTYVYERKAIMWFFKSFFLNPRADEHYLSIYIQPQYRAGPYILGVLTGFWVYNNIKLRLSKKQTWCTLLIGCAIMQLCFWSGSLYHNPARPYNVLESSLFAASTTNIWAFGLCLVIVSVIMGTKTPGSVILSWKPFTFLGKLSYNVYLIHHVLQVYSTGSRRTGNHFNFLNQVTESTYDMTLSIFFAFILFVTVETPPRYISKQMQMKLQKSSVSPAPIQK